MAELLVSFDQIVDIARFMGLVVCLSCFYMAVCVYFYQKLHTAPFGSSYGASPAGLVVAAIMGLGAVASVCIFGCMTCRNFRHRNSVNGGSGHDWILSLDDGEEYPSP